MIVQEHTADRLAMQSNNRPAIFALWALVAITLLLMVFGFVIQQIWMIMICAGFGVMLVGFIYALAKSNRTIILDHAYGVVEISETGLFSSFSQEHRLSIVTGAFAEAETRNVPFHYQTARGTRLYLRFVDGGFAPVFRAMLPAKQGQTAADQINTWIAQNCA